MADLSERTLWNRIADVSGVPSHQWSYCAALAESGLSPQIFEVRADQGRLVIPLFERFFEGTRDVCTILSVSGAWATGKVGQAVAMWQAHARTKGWVAGYLQFEHGCDLSDLDDCRPGNEILNLDLPEREFAYEASRDLRAKLRKARMTGAEVVDDRTVLADALVALYPEAMRRLGAGPAYALSAGTLHKLVWAPEYLVLGAAIDGRIEAVAVFPRTTTRAEYFLSAASPRGRSLSALVIHDAIHRLARDGVRCLNLGGGVRPGDGIYEFKRRFGGEPAQLQALCQVYDPEVFSALCLRSPEPVGSRWFPPYRASTALNHCVSMRQ